MGVSVTGGRGAGFVLNLVPMVDLMSVQITFLIATAVWMDASSLQVDEAAGEATATTAPLELRVSSDRVWVGRGALGADVPAGDAAALARAVREARDGDTAGVVRADDDVAYAAVVAAVDALAAEGLDAGLGDPIAP